MVPLIISGTLIGEDRQISRANQALEAPDFSVGQGQKGQGSSAQGQNDQGADGQDQGPSAGPMGQGGPQGPGPSPGTGLFGVPLPPRGAPPPLRLQDVSWIYMGEAPPRKIKVHDIITVIVDEKSQVTQQSKFTKQRNATFTAQLRQFVRIDSYGNLAPAATDQPSIDGQLRSQLNANGLVSNNEAMRYRIAATVVDVLPNGTLILEARKSLRTNVDLWEYSLTGRIRSEDVMGNNTVLSENVADLYISKRETGKVYDSTKRGWLMRLYDIMLPF